MVKCPDVHDLGVCRFIMWSRVSNSNLAQGNDKESSSSGCQGLTKSIYGLGSVSCVGGNSPRVERKPMRYSGEEIREITFISVLLIVSGAFFYYSIAGGQ